MVSVCRVRRTLLCIRLRCTVPSWHHLALYGCTRVMHRRAYVVLYLPVVAQFRNICATAKECSFFRTGRVACIAALPCADLCTSLAQLVHILYYYCIQMRVNDPHVWLDCYPVQVLLINITSRVFPSRKGSWGSVG